MYLKKFFDKVIPKYAVVPLLLLVLMNTVTYNGSKIITNHMFHHNAAIFIDSYIPFWPVFISFYILAFVQWIVGYILIARESKEYCYRYFSAELIAKSFCLFFFLIFPTTMERPFAEGSGIWLFLTRFIYSIDASVNLFPSIHCLESWMCFRGSLGLKKVPKWYKYFTFFFSICVCLSTVFVKQHVFIDIIGGILVVEIGILFSHKWNTSILFEKIESKLKKRCSRGSKYESRRKAN